MADILTKKRFDDDGEMHSYHGFNYQIVVEAQTFSVRIYDDEPDIATVLAPTNAQRLRETKSLFESLKHETGRSRFKLYCGSVGTYREIDPESLVFINL